MAEEKNWDEEENVMIPTETWLDDGYIDQKSKRRHYQKLLNIDKFLMPDWSKMEVSDENPDTDTWIDTV